MRSNKRALQPLAEQPSLAVDCIASFLDRLTRDEAQRFYERYIGPYFTPDGHVDLDIARQGIDAVAAELGVASVAVDEVYLPSTESRRKAILAEASWKYLRPRRPHFEGEGSEPPWVPSMTAGKI